MLKFFRKLINRAYHMGWREGFRIGLQVGRLITEGEGVLLSKRGTRFTKEH